MNEEQANKLKPFEFQRLFGVLPETYRKMVDIVKRSQQQKKKSGRLAKLSISEQVLLTLEDVWKHLETRNVSG
ncbi:MAG: hypothetical protein GDA56_24395 [Hormoscilla sp. GM7CHS1pb]|nr:hypothetical protein [Hormoscilla sp. GM7CHS1pb]